MSLYFDKNVQTPQNDTVNSWRVNIAAVNDSTMLTIRKLTIFTEFILFIYKISSFVCENSENVIIEYIDKYKSQSHHSSTIQSQYKELMVSPNIIDIY